MANGTVEEAERALQPARGMLKARAVAFREDGRDGPADVLEALGADLLDSEALGESIAVLSLDDREALIRALRAVALTAHRGGQSDAAQALLDAAAFLDFVQARHRRLLERQQDREPWEEDGEAWRSEI